MKPFHDMVFRKVLSRLCCKNFITVYTYLNVLTMIYRRFPTFISISARACSMFIHSLIIAFFITIIIYASKSFIMPTTYFYVSDNHS